MKFNFIKFSRRVIIIPAYLTLLNSGNATANDGLCSEDSRCYTSGTAAAAGTGFGIKSAKEFSRADLFEKENTRIGYKLDTESPSSLKPNELYDYGQLNHLEDGARVTINYHLNPIENREYHISLELQKAAQAKSSYEFHKLQSMTAMKTVHTYDDKGNISGSYMEPDYATRSIHAVQASQSAGEAVLHEQEAANARNPEHVVPTYELKQVIGADQDVSKTATLDFLESSTQHEHVILRIEVLPKKAKILIAKMQGKALKSLAATLLLFSGAAVELVTGGAANQIEEQGNKLKIHFDTKNFNFENEKNN